jgi:hypothetical protein
LSPADQASDLLTRGGRCEGRDRAADRVAEQDGLVQGERGDESWTWASTP